MHDTSSKNAQVSPITTSFPWRHTNTCMNHGYNAVADDYRQVSSATTSFPWRHTNTCKNHGYNVSADDSGQVSSATTWRHINTRKNHGYNAVAGVSCTGSRVVPRILYSLHTKKVKKVEKDQTFSDHTYPRSLPDEGGDVCKVWFRNVDLYKVQTNKNEQKTISVLYIR